MDLEQAGQQARDQFKAIKDELHTAEGVFADVDNRVNEATQHIHADWAKVEAAVKAFIDELHHRKAELDTERTNVHEAHGHLRQEIDTAHNDSHEATEHAHTELIALKEHAISLEKQHTQHLDDASQKGQQIKEQVHQVEHDLATLAQTVAHFLGEEIGQQLSHLGELFEKHSHDWEMLITDNLVPQMHSKAQETHGKLQEFHSNFQQHGDNLAEEAKTQSTEAAQKCTQDHHDTLGTLHDAAEELKNTLGQLGAFLGKGVEIIEDGKQTLKTGVETTNVGLNAAIGILKDLKDFFEGFSFI